jgi:hypothetical protein
MTLKQELQAIARRERRIDEALMETFPASDTPSFVGAGALKPTDDKAKVSKRRTKAAKMAGDVIDKQADLSATSDERESRKRRLLKGPKEFREIRHDQPIRKR